MQKLEQETRGENVQQHSVKTSLQSADLQSPFTQTLKPPAHSQTCTQALNL